MTSPTQSPAHLLPAVSRRNPHSSSTSSKPETTRDPIPDFELTTEPKKETSIMTAMTDLNAITLTATAKAWGSVNGVDLVGLITQSKTDIIELQNRLRQIVKFHPAPG